MLQLLQSRLLRFKRGHRWNLVGVVVCFHTVGQARSIVFEGTCREEGSGFTPSGRRGAGTLCAAGRAGAATGQQRVAEGQGVSLVAAYESAS